MNVKTFICLWACLAGACAQWLRPPPDISPSEIAYISDAGLPTFAQFLGYNGTNDGAGVKSFWFISYLTLANGHEYYLLHSTSNSGPSNVSTSITLMDITAKHYSGRAWSHLGQMSNTKADSLTPDFLHIYATTEDNYSQYKSVSVVPAYPFNLTLTPKGAGSYQLAAGTYMWGGARCWAWDAPEALTTGTLTIDGKEVAVIPEKSVTWMDWQYGPGFASEGWYSFVLTLINGVKITTMTTYPTPKYTSDSLATLAFPDGHHEVYALTRDFHPTDPWVSPDTNITYYNSYQVNIPAKGIFLNVTLAMEGGELYNHEVEGIIIADTFSYVVGLYEGLPISGWGNSERFAGNSPHV